MNTAEFSCAREYLGLPAVWVAEKMNVDRRTVYRWEQGKTRLPDWAASQMQAWVAITEQAVGKATVELLGDNNIPLEAIPDDLNDTGFPFPPSWQRMLCSRVAERTGRTITWAKQ